jgi:hypothetical protein
LPLVESCKWQKKKNVLVDKKGTMVLVTKIVINNKKLQMARYVPVDEMDGCILLVSYKDCR